MKKFIIALVAFMGALTVSAQGFGGGEMKPEDIAKFSVNHIKEVCKINEEQEKKFTEYFVDQAKKTIEMFKKAQENGGGFDIETMQKTYEAQMKYIKSVLTEDQWKLYEEDQKKMMERFSQEGPMQGQ